MISAQPMVGTAGWNVPAQHAAHFPAVGSHLERYAGRLNAVEINSSFYRPHRRATYERWAASVPAGFRFAVKIPKAISHEHRLIDTAEPVDRFLSEATGLGDRLGPLLLQLPPSLRFDAGVADAFLYDLRRRHAGAIVCEPRHPSWFEPAAEALLVAHDVNRVAADPAIVPQAAAPGGSLTLAYYRLHGSPRIYYSAYEAPFLDHVAARLADHAAKGTPAWCIFDNTAAFAATADALTITDQRFVAIAATTAMRSTSA